MFKRFYSLVAGVILLTFVTYSSQMSLETIVRGWNARGKYVPAKPGVIDGATEKIRKDLLRTISGGECTVLDMILMYYHIYEGFAGKNIGTSGDHYINARTLVDEMHKNKTERKVLNELEILVVATPTTVTVIKYKGMVFMFPTINMNNEVFVLDTEDGYFGDTSSSMIKMDKGVYDLGKYDNKGK